MVANSPPVLLTRRLQRAVTIAALSSLILPACSGGGGGGSSGFDETATLTAISFPDPSNVNPEPELQAPLAAPLVQQIVLEFSGRPNPNQVTPDRIRIRDLRGSEVPGSFSVEQNRVTFTPDLPREPVVGGFDSGGAGLRPGTSYTIGVGPGTWPGFVKAVDASLASASADPSNPRNVLVTFRTTSNSSDFFRGIAPRRPRLQNTNPLDGATGISPGLYGDPDQRFPARRSFRLTFDGPIHPQQTNLDGFRLVDLEDRSPDSPTGLSLGITVRLQENTLERSVVEVEPHGILPFGHLLSLEYPSQVRGLSQGEGAGPATTVAATFTVANAPSGVIRDVLSEDFDGRDRQETADVDPGVVLAQWDQLDSNLLEPGFLFRGEGELGPFTPPPPDRPSEIRTVVLDTSRQTFPLLDGSTPSAPPGMVIEGGVFPFSEIDIPEGVVVIPKGPNPLILSATGNVTIAGEINLLGSRGTDENTFDSAVAPLPGGQAASGGGRGGDGQPLYYRGNLGDPLALVSPPRGGQGWGPSNREAIGGQGGQSGILDTNRGEEVFEKEEGVPCPEGFVEETRRNKVVCVRRFTDDDLYGRDREVNCDELAGFSGSVDNHSNGYKAPGGGGGSFFRPGKQTVVGEGNVITDGQGNFILRRPETHAQYDVLESGLPGAPVFVDEISSNDFLGPLGERQEIHGGQGGGAGGTGLDGYYCGHWCKTDADPRNNQLCKPDRFMNFPDTRFASSVGDSRGGGGGGGGGALAIEALGSITMEPTGRIACAGGGGAGGEALGCSNYGGSGGGGSGGAIVLRSATSIDVTSGATLNVRGGPGRAATKRRGWVLNCVQMSSSNPGAGGDGGAGIIQLQVPAGKTANVASDANVVPRASWVDKSNLRNPSQFTDVSQAVSRWYDLGRVTKRPPANTNPVFFFRGLDNEGYVPTDDQGFVIEPDKIDIRVDFLGQEDPNNPGTFRPGLEPKAHFIPTNATVRVQFQGARAITEGSKEIDPDTVTDWAPSPTIANSMQFLRYRVTFDLAAEDQPVTKDTPRPVVQKLSIRAEF